jgi:dimethylsulfone monooxygenase
LIGYRSAFLGAFLHFQEEIEYFGSRVLPLVREIEDSEEDSVGELVLASA